MSVLSGLDAIFVAGFLTALVEDPEAAAEELCSAGCDAAHILMDRLGDKIYDEYYLLPHTLELKDDSDDPEAQDENTLQLKEDALEIKADEHSETMKHEAYPMSYPPGTCYLQVFGIYFILCYTLP